MFGLVAAIESRESNMNIVNNIRDVLSKLAKLLSDRHKKLCFIVMLLTIAGSVLETLGVSVIMPLMQAITEPEELLTKSVLSGLFSTLHVSMDNVIAFTVAGCIVVYILKNVYLVFLSYVRARFSALLQRDLGVKLMNEYMSRDYQYFLRVDAHHMYRGITGDVGGVYSTVYFGLRLISELLTCLCIVVLVIRTDALIATGLIVIGAVCVLATVVLSKRKMKELGAEVRKYDTRMKNAAYQAFYGIKEVMVMHKQSAFSKEYEEACDNLQNATVLQSVVAESPVYLFEAVCVIGLVGTIGIELSAGMAGENFIPNLATIAMAAFRIMPSLGRIANYANNMMFQSASLNSAYNNQMEAENYLQQRSKVIDKGRDSSDLKFSDTVSLRDISFRYDGAEVYVLRNLDLSFKKGDAIALIGESGAGKSTVADIILGLLTPSMGTVSMDGTDIHSIPETWCRTIGYVPQAVYILNDSIRKNVAFGVPEPEIDDDRIWRALEQAQIAEYVRSLPEGLDAALGDRGVRISGGQRQRIAIARALYYDPEILLLDEATSALDNKTEESVMEAIDVLHGKKTLIIVAHRLSTIEKCNHIFEIKGGIAVERTREEVFG